MSNLKDKAFIENADGTVEEVSKKENPSIKGDLTKVAKVYTAPMPIRTFEAYKVGDLIEIIKEQGTEYEKGFYCLTVFEENGTRQHLEYNVEDDEVILSSYQKEETDMYSIDNTIRVVLNKEDHIARYDGLLNKVDNVIEYTDEIDKLSKLLK